VNDTYVVTWERFRKECTKMLEKRPIAAQYVYGVPTGGIFVAQELARQSAKLAWSPHIRPGVTWVVDDLVDSGKTLKPFADDHPVDALFRKPQSPERLAPHATEVADWIQFPWEHEASPTDAVVRLLQWVGEDPNRPGILETPARVTKALKEMCSGYEQDPKQILSKQFEADHDEMVVIADITFESLCEHHILPFVGTCAIGYIPKGSVVGASKLPRLVRCFAKRLQIQERLTTQIAKAIEANVPCGGVGVVMSAQHMCMMVRGVEQKKSKMQTSCLLGSMRVPEVRSEFLRLAGF